jgi:hypothetical protein
MAEILIGTCGYSYHEWVGPVYPEGTKPGVSGLLCRAVPYGETGFFLLCYAET